jgi:membrane protein implicated in regulation of membrane protease activity
MRGAPWEGLFYGFVVEAMVAIGSFAYALETQDFLARTLAWALFAFVVVVAVRTLRRAVGQREHPDRPVGRWWFGG